MSERKRAATHLPISPIILKVGVDQDTEWLYYMPAARGSGGFGFGGGSFVQTVVSY